MVTLVDEPCQINVTCDEYGNSLEHYHYVEKRSVDSDDQITSLAPPKCRTIKSPPGTCWFRYWVDSSNV